MQSVWFVRIESRATKNICEPSYFHARPGWAPIPLTYATPRISVTGGPGIRCTWTLAIRGNCPQRESPFLAQSIRRAMTLSCSRLFYPTAFHRLRNGPSWKLTGTFSGAPLCANSLCRGRWRKMLTSGDTLPACRRNGNVDSSHLLYTCVATIRFEYAGRIWYSSSKEIRARKI